VRINAVYGYFGTVLVQTVVNPGALVPLKARPSPVSFKPDTNGTELALAFPRNPINGQDGYAIAV
jgi:hypothetical protein